MPGALRIPPVTFMEPGRLLLSMPFQSSSGECQVTLITIYSAPFRASSGINHRRDKVVPYKHCPNAAGAGRAWPVHII